MAAAVGDRFIGGGAMSVEVDRRISPVAEGRTAKMTSAARLLYTMPMPGVRYYVKPG